jgi:hypothetical protein
LKQLWPLWNFALPGACSGGAEVVRRMASHNFRGSDDKAKSENKICEPLIKANEQAEIQGKIGVASVESHYSPCD